MNYNKLLLIITFLLLAISLWGQDFDLKYRRNGTVNTFTTESVTSDYGRRGLDTSPWHKGIDYGGQAGDQLLPLVSGTVKDIRYNEGTMYKAVIIDGVESNDFGWGHIFHNNDKTAYGNDNPENPECMISGHLVLKEMDYPNNTRYCILNTVTRTAIGEIDEATVTYTFDGDSNSTSITISNEVAEGDVIAPSGTSGRWNNGSQTNFGYGPHVHVYSIRDVSAEAGTVWDEPAGDLLSNGNLADPLELIIHDEPSYDVNIVETDINYGNNYSSIKVRCEMKDSQNCTPPTANHYDNVVMDIDDVDLLIENQHNESCSHIQGPYYYSWISHGGREYRMIYPNAITAGVAGSFTRTGIDPYAYRDPIDEVEQGYPYDDYYFSDFYLRLHKDDEFGDPIDFVRDGEIPIPEVLNDSKPELAGYVGEWENAGHTNGKDDLPCATVEIDLNNTGLGFDLIPSDEIDSRYKYATE